MTATASLILDDLRRHATERPGARAVVAVDAAGACRELTWRELDEEVDRVAAMLLSLGVAAGEPVAFQLPNRIEFVTLALATLRVGAVCEPLMPILRARELRFMLGESNARVLVVPARFRGHDHLAMALGLRDEGSAPQHVVVLDGPAEVPPSARHWQELVGGASPDPEQLAARRPAPDDIAQLLFTSGTSGEPKGALHRHDVLTKAADAHIRHFGLGPDDVIYVPSPLAHQTGFLYGMWIALRLGVPQVLQETWDAGVGLRTMRSFGVTFVQAATPFLADLVRMTQTTGERPERLRVFVATGAAVPRELAREARDALRAEVGGAWGTTESCLGAAFAPGDPPERAWSTDGRALDNISLWIVDDAGRPIPAGREGHFEVQTDCLFEGYLNRPELTAEVLTADGYYRTGDLARLDEDGYLHITGRVKDVINRGGEKVPVVEIEQILYDHPAVREVAIVAMPDERLGERACAFVVLEPGAELDLPAVQRHLAARSVSKTYWPERLECTDELPRTPSGKIQKYVLRERAGQATHRKAVPT
jgi:3-phosphoshikimate 1-carboxyvinyltransferase